MNNIKDIIKELKKAKARVFVEGESLQIDVGKGIIDDRLKSLIQVNKSSLIKYINHIRQNEYLFIPRVVIEGSYGLSSSQRRIWVLSQFEEGNIAYNMPSVYQFEGDLDLTSLRYCFNTVVTRHEILRTVFREDGQGEVRQVILPEGNDGFSIKYIDVRKDGTVADLGAIIESESLKPFDLAEGPLLRAGLYHLSDKRWVFIYTMHHIIGDGWSMGVLINELLRLYSSHIKGEPSPLEPLRIQYKDYSGWQQAQLRGEALKSHKAYWLDQFSGELPVLDLPGDKPRPAVKTYNGGTVDRVLNAELSAGIRSISQDGGCTLFMGLLAGVNMLMYRYTGQADIILGSPIAGRDHADLEDQIGFYVNTLALRSRFKGTDSYLELLRHVREVTLGGYEHQFYPFDELIDDLNLKRDMSRQALFDVLVVLQNIELEHKNGVQQIGDLEVTEYKGPESQTSKFDLTFNFIELGETIALSIEYNSDIYERETADRLGYHLEQLLNAAVSAPEKAIGELDYLSKTERSQLVEEFNNTAVSYPDEKTIVNLFEEQVLRSPDSIALVFEGVTLSYRELNERSNRLAMYLREEYKIKADELIGIMLDRSEWMIISILGVLKSGGAYVPIDPDYPEERKVYMESDSQCKVLIDEEELGRFRKEEERYGHENPKPVNKAEDLAYVIYTSGSTGKPKGVMIEHRGVVRLVKSTNYVSFSSNDVLLSTGAISFDATTFEFWGILLNGGQLIICPNELLLNINKLAEKIKEKVVNIMWFTSGWFNQLVDSNINVFYGLKTILVGGDKLSIFHINALRLLYPELNVINGYGPTENTTFSLTYPITSPFTNIPLGKPINNSTAYILEMSHLKLQPIGVIGEICIGGAGLARGYLNQPELTEAKFISNPYKDGERLYRTGDLGRWLPDGNIEFIGRKDDQVKIRGYRIELGEIESALRVLEQISDAVVTAIESGSGEKELVAYIVSGASLNVTEIRARLSVQLPLYMVPGYYVQLEKMPLTPNGKIDKRSLPSPEGLGLSTGVSYVGPRNETEARLIKIWQEILGRQDIGVKDDFFDLGGNSLKVIRLLSRLKNEFKSNFRTMDIFNNTTPESLAKVIVRHNWINESSISNNNQCLII